MLLSAVSVLVVAQSSSEIPEGLMNNPVYFWNKPTCYQEVTIESDVPSLTAEQDLHKLLM